MPDATDFLVYQLGNEDHQFPGWGRRQLGLEQCLVEQMAEPAKCSCSTEEVAEKVDTFP